VTEKEKQRTERVVRFALALQKGDRARRDFTAYLEEAEHVVDQLAAALDRTDVIELAPTTKTLARPRR
jgi:hypothetical protein